MGLHAVTTETCSAVLGNIKWPSHKHANYTFCGLKRYIGTWLTNFHLSTRILECHSCSFHMGMGQYLQIHFSGMNIHLPAILGFTRYQGFDTLLYLFMPSCERFAPPCTRAPHLCVSVTWVTLESSSMWIFPTISVDHFAEMISVWILQNYWNGGENDLKKFSVEF